VLSDGSQSLVNNANLVGKVYFPRLIVPSATVAVALVDAAVTLGLLAIMMIWKGFLPDWRVVTLPLFVVLAMAASLGPALLMTALNVKYRDFRYIIPFVLQFGLYVSPVGFSSTVVPERWRLLYSANPIVGVIDGFRWALLRGEAQIYWPGFFVSLGVTALMLLVGVTYFRKTERSFADLI
jgi:lipopolysaccharide transport system permease protein